MIEGKAPCAQTSVPLTLHGRSLDKGTWQNSQLNNLYFNKSIILPITNHRAQIPLTTSPKKRLRGKTPTANIIATFSATTYMLKSRKFLCKAGISGQGGGKHFEECGRGHFISLGERDSSGLLGLAQLHSRNEPKLIWVVETNCTCAYRKIMTGAMKSFETT